MSYDTNTDFSDCTWKLQIGKLTRHSLFRHIRERLPEEIEARGFAARDPQLFNQFMIEVRARYIADAVCDTAEQDPDVYAFIDGEQLRPDIARDLIVTEMDRVLADEFAKDNSFGLQFLMKRATE